jgi:catechol-2,3-dioxygenase
VASELRKLTEILERGPLMPAKLSHVVLRTARLKPARDWYLTTLNGHVQYEDATVCFLTYDEEHHRIGIVQIPGVTDEVGTGPGLEHISFAYRTLGELLAHYRRLKALGIVPYWTINHAAQANSFIEQHYAENFMGIIFDPEDMIRQYEAGVSVDDIVRRPKLPAGKTAWDMHRP